MYIYPENLRSKAVLWFWELRDICIIGILGLISMFLFSIRFYVPIVITGTYLFLTIKFQDTSIMDFIINAYIFFFKQQTYEWKLK